MKSRECYERHTGCDGPECVRVKLRWVKRPVGCYWYADTAAGEFSISTFARYQGRTCTAHGYHLGYGRRSIGDFDTLAKAKLAAALIAAAEAVSP